MSEDEQGTYIFERQLASSLRHRSPIGHKRGKDQFFKFSAAPFVT